MTGAWPLIWMETYSVEKIAINSQVQPWADSLLRHSASSSYFSSSFCPSHVLPLKFAHQPQTRNQTRLSEKLRAHPDVLLVHQKNNALKHNSLTKSSSCSSARSINSLTELNDLPAKRILKERLMVNLRELLSHIGEDERCKRRPWTHFSNEVSFHEGWEREYLKIVSWDSNFNRTTNDIDLLALDVRLCPCLHLAQSLKRSLWTSHWTLFTSFINFLFRGNKREKWNSNFSNGYTDNRFSVRLGPNDAVKRDFTFLWYFRSWIRRRWLLFGGYITSFMQIYNFLMSVLSASIDVILNIRGHIEEWSSKFHIHKFCSLHLFTVWKFRLNFYWLHFITSDDTAESSEHLTPDGACRVHFCFYNDFFKWNRHYQ